MQNKMINWNKQKQHQKYKYRKSSTQVKYTFCTPVKIL